MRRYALALGLTAALAMPAAADYYDGLRAYDAGDYSGAAREWLGAARAGDARSQYQLGRIYEHGSGVPQSFVHAHLWYNRAAAGGSGAAREAREALAARMSAGQLARAQELAVRPAPASASGRRSEDGGARRSARPVEAPTPAAVPVPKPNAGHAMPPRANWPQASAPSAASGAFDGRWSGRAFGDNATLCARWFDIDLTIVNGRATGVARGGSAYCPLSGSVATDGTGYFGGWCGATWADIKVSFNQSVATGGFAGNVGDCWGSLAMTRVSN